MSVNCLFNIVKMKIFQLNVTQKLYGNNGDAKHNILLVKIGDKRKIVIKDYKRNLRQFYEIS